MLSLLFPFFGIAAALTSGPDSSVLPLCPFNEAKVAAQFHPDLLKKTPIEDIRREFARRSESYGKCESIRKGKKGDLELVFQDAAVPFEVELDKAGKITSLKIFPAVFRHDSLSKAIDRASKLYPEGFSYAVTNSEGKLLHGHLAETPLTVGDSAELLLIKEIREKQSNLAEEALEKQLSLMVLDKNETARAQVLNRFGKKKLESKVTALQLCQSLVILKNDPILQKIPSILRREGTWKMIVGDSSWSNELRQVTELLLAPGKSEPICVAITLNSNRGVEPDRAEEIFRRIFNNLPENRASSSVKKTQKVSDK